MCIPAEDPYVLAATVEDPDLLFVYILGLYPDSLLKLMVDPVAQV